MKLNGPLIKVDGVPHNATKRDLHILFSSVAQINWITLNRHKKSAILSLYDKSSTDFVLQKEWIYDKSTLRLSKVGKERIEGTHKEAGCQKSDKPPFFSNRFIQAPKLSPFEEYHQGKSKFWEDVPHEKAVPVKTAVRYKKRKSACTGAKIVAAKHKKEQPRRRKQKLKIPKLNLEMSYEQFLEEIKYFSQVQLGERHSNVQQIKQNQDLLENKGAKGPSRTKIQLIFKAKSTFTLDILDGMNISMETIRSFVQRKDKICASMQLLLYEGHILQEDHLRHLKNGDCIHVLCRGKGGMHCGSSDKEEKDDSTCLLRNTDIQDLILPQAHDVRAKTKSVPSKPYQSRAITDKSSEDEVQKWLVDVVHIDPAYRDKFDFMDGKSICHCQDYTELSSILSIPIGLARKVFYMRSQDSWLTDIDIDELRTWSIDDLSVHLKDVKYKQLKEILQNKCIDGLTFLTYSFSAKEELKRDFGLQEGGLHLRLWTESQKLKESLTLSKTNNPKTATSECMSDEFDANYFPLSSHQVKQNEQPVNQGEKNQHAKIPFQNENNLDPFVDNAGATESSQENMKQSISRAENTFERTENKLDVSLSDIYQILEKKLGLCPLKPVTNEFRQLKLMSIGSPNKLSTQNLLEKTFLFTVLFEESKIDNVKQYLKFLWKKITENTKKWVEYLPPGARRDKFKNAKGVGTAAFNVDGKKVKMSGIHKCHSLKQIENDICQYQHFFLLVDDHILEDSFLDNSGYKVYLDELCLYEYGFCFNSKVKYLTYNSRDYFGEFTEFTEINTRQEHVEAALFSQAKNDLHLENNDKNEISKSDKEKAEKMYIVDQIQVNILVKSDATQPEASDRLNAEISENRSLANIETEPISYPDSTVCIQNSASNFIVNISDKCQNRRHFKAEGSSTMYHKDWVLDRQETGSGMMIPSVEFKYFSTSFQCGDKNEPIKKFIFETLRFACGCLNRRRNGTIYFGVADGGVPIEGMKYRDGQIIGFPIDDFDHCTMKKYIDELDHAINKYVEHPDAKKAAKECIRSPEFIKVTSHTGLKLFVMEVDIEPSISFCKQIAFYLNLRDFQNETGRKTKGKTPLNLFVRDGSKTVSVDRDYEKYFLKELYEKYDIERKSQEMLSVQHVPFIEKKAEKLYRKICMGQQGFNKSLWPILLLTKPDDIKMNNPTWLEDFKFLKSGHWVCALDFNDHSYESGILGQIFPKGKTTVTNEEKFRYVENVVQLRDELESPAKVVWIFSNGRKELGKAHKDRKEWIDEYSSGIKGAVQFFHQRSVIPENRAIIIFFILSDDFAGVVETLFELVSHFSWKRIVIIADKQESFDKFKHVVESERNFCQEDLEGSSVVGLSWKEVSSIFEDAMHLEVEGDCKVPSSSGAIMTVDTRFLEQLKDLKILSATKYENVKFQMDDKKSFSHEKEKKFYQGNKVDWWNFFFETHVLKRHCFNSLLQKVKTALTKPRSDYQNIITITIIHEPGAGGSTLANHILWELRKEFKCATLERLTENTCDEIFELWKMFESNLECVQPVLILVDDLFLADINLNELYRKIHFMYREKKLGMKTALPVCVLLQCRKEDDITNLHANVKINNNVTELLYQKLEEKGPINEKEWCEKKYLEFEKTGQELGLGKYAPEHLIAFMILRSGFNMEFIKNTINSMLINIDPDSKEFKLLKYVSLLFSYVESHNEANDIHIPLECCDQLMSDTNLLNRRSHKDYPWEYSLHDPVKILLRIEDKQEGSGRQIKMAHQNLASKVLECIKNKTKQSTVSIVLEYMKSDLLNNYSYAKVSIQKMTKEMLIRRQKEEYSDRKTTTFSPLVEDMLKESSYQEIAEVLSLGYDQLKDGMIAQQIARLYKHEKDFENAKKWADTARSTAPQRSDFIHTCGLVMTEKFSHLLKESNSKPTSPSNQILLVKIAFQAVDTFREGTSLIMKQKAAYNLFLYVDIIGTVLKLLDFVSKNVKPFNIESVFHNYLMSPDFIPEELPEEWNPFHEKFKALYDIGESAFRHIEDLVLCHTTFYESKYLHTKERMEHPSNRHVKRILPGMQTKFSRIFGEKEEGMKDIYITDSDMRNNWYRRRLLDMKANSFIKIFNIVAFKKNQTLAEEAIKKLKEAKHYLQNISPLTDCDLANTISVNVALAQLRASDRESTRNVFTFCKELLNLNRKFLDVASFFIMIILWPNKDDLDGVEYDDTLFHKALQTLGELFITKKEQILDSKTEAFKFKQEHNVFRATTQFFLTRGKGLRSICHRSELFLKDNADLARDESWESPPPPHLNLMLLEGVSSSSSKGNFIIVLNKIFGQGKTIKIRNSYRRTGSISEEKVSFYLGFSFEGLVAYGVKPISGNKINSWRTIKYTDYNEVPKDQLLEKLRKIEKIKAKRENNVLLFPDEEELLLDEVDIRDALSPEDSDFYCG